MLRLFEKKVFGKCKSKRDRIVEARSRRAERGAETGLQGLDVPMHV